MDIPVTLELKSLKCRKSLNNRKSGISEYQVSVDVYGILLLQNTQYII